MLLCFVLVGLLLLLLLLLLLNSFVFIAAVVAGVLLLLLCAEAAAELLRRPSRGSLETLTSAGRALSLSYCCVFHRFFVLQLPLLPV